jgi:hypothetical protein
MTDVVQTEGGSRQKKWENIMIDKNPQIIWILKIGKIKKLLDEHF